MNPLTPKTVLLLIAFGLFLAASCSKGGSPNGTKGGNDTITTTTTLDPGDSAIVYVAAVTTTGVYCWRNGIPFPLALPATQPLPENYVPLGRYYVSGITLSDTDVYISGGTQTEDTTRQQYGYTANYWRNGVPIYLQDSSAGAQSFGIAVSGTNVLVAGTETYAEPKVDVPFLPLTPFMSYAKYGSIAVCWTNGAPSYVISSFEWIVDEHDTGITYLPDYVTGIVVNGSDTYLVGGSNSFSIGVPSSLHFTGYWKNGGFYDLPNKFTGTVPNDSTGWFSPQAAAIAVSGNDVYVSGTNQNWLGMNGAQYVINYQAMFWKNGALTYLAGTDYNSGASGLCVSGSDVYVAGYLGPVGKAAHAVYWKNGAPIMLDSTSDASAAQYIAVLGKNVYVAGWVNNAAVYWRNGKMFPLNGTSARSLCGIAIRNH